MVHGRSNPAQNASSGESLGSLVVFFSCGVSIENWQRTGILDREMALYHRLREVFPQIIFLTYGGEEDCRIAEGLGFRALPKRSPLDPFRYSFIAPWVYRRELRRAAVLKTNQFDGAWVAAIARLFFRKPLVVRGGYLLSLRAERDKWSRRGQWWARNAEKWACRIAHRVVVTTGPMRQEVVRRYRLSPDKVLVNPNFVDATLFSPALTESRVGGRVGFVGRLEQEKNVDMLIRAVSCLEGVELCIVGEGTLRPRLEGETASRGARVRFLGTVPNQELPRFYRSCECVVLSSSYEGHPKVLIEAMACGTPVVGTNVDGIRDLVADGRTGLLVDLSEESLAAGIRKVRENRGLAAELGRNAREFVRREFSLDTVATREKELYRELLRLK